MKKQVLCLMLALVLTVCITFPGMSRADFGDFSGDTDFGSIDWDTGTDWGSDWGSDWDSDWDSDWEDDSDWGYGGPIIFNTGGHGGGGYSSGYVSGYDDDRGSSFSDSFFLMVVVILIVLFVMRRMKAGNKPAGAQMTDLNTLNPMASYRELDEGFDEASLR